MRKTKVDRYFFLIKLGKIYLIEMCLHFFLIFKDTFFFIYNLKRFLKNGIYVDWIECVFFIFNSCLRFLMQIRGTEELLLNDSH